jgi:FkbM family methyltransferase
VKSFSSRLVSPRQGRDSILPGSNRFVGNTLAKWGIAGFARAFPHRARKVLMMELCKSATATDAYSVFQELGRRCGIVDIRIPGDCGLIEGALADRGVLASYVRTRRWAPTLTQIVERFFTAHDKGTYIDIGANIGLTTIPIARHAFVHCKAFEPEPQTFRYLATNVRQNCAGGNVDIFNLALSNMQGTVAFELADDNFGDHRIRVTKDDGDFGEAKRQVIEVRADRLDDVLSVHALSKPIALKIDTQGAECRILEGGKTVFEAASLLAFEFWPYGLRRMASDPESLISFVGAQFSTGAILPEGNDAPTWQPIGSLVEMLRDFSVSKRDEPYETWDVVVKR